MIYLKKQKALSSLLILIIISVTVIIAVGALAIYLWFSPGQIKTEEMQYSDFTSVDVGSAFNLEITKSNSYSVIITADEKIFDDIEVTKIGNTLAIGIKPGIIITVSTLKAQITMPNLNELVFSGASNGVIEGFSTSELFVVKLSGASRLEMEDVNVGAVNFHLSGASILIGEGSGNDLTSIVEGASSLDLTDFPVNNCNLTVSGASQATVDLDGKLDAVVTGASTVFYIGDPVMGNIDVSDTSTIEQK